MFRKEEEQNEKRNWGEWKRKTRDIKREGEKEKREKEDIR